MAGSLFDIVMKKGHVLTPDRAAKYMRKLSRAVDYLHESNIILYYLTCSFLDLASFFEK